MKKPFIIAHRYGNDLSRLEAAVEAGGRLCRGRCVAARGTAGSAARAHDGAAAVLLGQVAHLATADKPLLLDDVLAALPERMGVMLDLKGTERDMPEAILQSLRRHGHGHPVMVSSRFWDHLPSLIDYPDILLFFSVGRPWEMWRVRRLLELRENDAICVRYGMLSADEVRELKTKVALVSTWGSTTTSGSNVLAWSVDAIITDEVSIMRKIAERRLEESAAS